MANLSMKNCPWLKDLPKEDRNTTASYYANLGELVDRSIDPSICFFPNQSFIKKRATTL